MSKKIANIISSLILIVLIAAVAVFVAPKVVGVTPMVVLSGSMEPTYPVGSLIFVEKSEAKDLQVGDKVTFHLGNTDTVVTHRVVTNDSEKQEIITKGDANENNDGNPVSYASVIGKANDFAIPMLGYIGVFMNSTGGYIVMGCLILALILISFIGGNETKRKE